MPERPCELRCPDTTWPIQGVGQIKYFSDNLLVGYPIDKANDPSEVASFVLRCSQRYQLQMTLSGYFVRGAVARGPHCVTDDIIFGTSLIASYRLEANSSIVPRIVITDPVMKAAASHVALANDQWSLEEGDLLCRDIDGWWFVNYLQSAVEANGVSW